MATVRLIPDTRAKKDGSQMILLVIRIGKTRFVFSTGISTPSSEKFNEVSYLDKSVPQYKVKNVRLVSLKNKAEKLIIDDEARLSSLPSAKAKEIISEYVFDEKVVKKTRCFIDYLDEFVSIKSKYGTGMPIDVIYSYIQTDYEQDGYNDAMCNSDIQYKESKKKIINNGLKMLFEQVRLRYESDIRDINVQIDIVETQGLTSSSMSLKARKETYNEHLKKIKEMEDALDVGESKMMSMIDSYERGFLKGVAAKSESFIR